MKKAAFLITVLCAGLVSTAQFSPVNPFDELLRTDTIGTHLVRQLAAEIMSSEKNFIDQGGVDTGLPYLQQSFVVFEQAGQRFSIYYQCDTRDDLLNTEDYLAVYVRPIGTDSPESLTRYCDYHLNGSWDEYADNRCNYYWDDLIGSKLEIKIQNQYLVVLKQALSYLL